MIDQTWMRIVSSTLLLVSCVKAAAGDLSSCDRSTPTLPTFASQGRHRNIIRSRVSSRPIRGSFGCRAPAAFITSLADGKYEYSSRCAPALVDAVPHSRSFPIFRYDDKDQLRGQARLSVANRCREATCAPARWTSRSCSGTITTTTYSSLSTCRFLNSKSNEIEKEKLIDGKAIAASIRADIANAVKDLTVAGETVPGLAVILVGSRRDSQAYVNMKKKACTEVNFTSFGYEFTENVTESELLRTIQQLNHNPAVHGILVQLPLPVNLNTERILGSIDPAKDVDGLHPVNVAALQLFSGNNAVDAPFSIPCTPLGCLVLLDRVGVNVAGRHCVVIGRSHLVGSPMAKLLLSRDATVTICHSKTIDLSKICRTADVIVAAIGRAWTVQGNWIKPGAVVIDVGMNSVDVKDPVPPGGKTYKLVGDVDFKEALKKCSKITPVPGGVGPMTIAMLLRNTLNSCLRANARTKNGM